MQNSNDDRLTPHITEDMLIVLTDYLQAIHELDSLSGILRLTKQVIFDDADMSIAINESYPRIAEKGQFFWKPWAANCSRWLRDAPNERLILVDGIWCGSGLTAKIIQPHRDIRYYQVVVTDDDDWIEHSPPFETLALAQQFLTRLEPINSIADMYNALTLR